MRTVPISITPFEHLAAHRDDGTRQVGPGAR
jgi:hypothetical protein